MGMSLLTLLSAGTKVSKITVLLLACPQCKREVFTTYFLSWKSVAHTLEEKLGYSESARLLCTVETW